MHCCRDGYAASLPANVTLNRSTHDGRRTRQASLRAYFRLTLPNASKYNCRCIARSAHNEVRATSEEPTSLYRADRGHTLSLSPVKLHGLMALATQNRINACPYCTRNVVQSNYWYDPGISGFVDDVAGIYIIESLVDSTGWSLSFLITRSTRYHPLHFLFRFVSFVYTPTRKHAFFSSFCICRSGWPGCRADDNISGRVCDFDWRHRRQCHSRLLWYVNCFRFSIKRAKINVSSLRYRIR